MKSIHPTILAVGLALVPMPLDCLRAAETAPGDPSPGRKEFVVYSGLNVFAEAGGTLRRVIGGSDREILVLYEDTVAGVSPKDVALTAALEPKLSRIGTTIDSLDGYPVYSVATDPVIDAQLQQIAIQDVQAHNQDRAVADFRRAEEALRDRTQQGAPAREIETARQDVAKATNAMNAAHATPILNDILPGSSRSSTEFDGFEVSFRVSSSEPQENAYGVLRLIMRDPTVRGGSPVRQVLQLFRVRSLGAEKQKVVVRKIGLPSGFTVESYEIHLYVDGRELATNLSPNQFGLTEEQARQFLLLSYLGAHTGATLPPRVMEELRPSGVLAGLAPEYRIAVVDLEISAEGFVSGIRVGPADPAALRPETEAALRQVRFFPALVGGEPAAGTGTFALGELFQ